MHTVYECYDAAGQLLYVGCTANPAKRFAHHRCKTSWWPDVVRVEHRPFASRDDALDVEAGVIARRWPKHNRAFNPRLSIEGAALKAVRERSGLNLTGLSEASGIERSLLGKIERGHRKGTPEQARMLAAALKVPTVAILHQPVNGDAA